MANENAPPPPPSLNEAIRLRAGLPARTVMEELHLRFEARLKANGGKVMPLTAEELNAPPPPPPDYNEAVRQHRALQERKKK